MQALLPFLKPESRDVPADVDRRGRPTASLPRPEGTAADAKTAIAC